jgi:hypothetical protein
MCAGPVGGGQSYWGVIQIKISGDGMTEQQLDDFKTQLRKFLDGQSVSSGLPQNASASLANGAIKTDDPEDATSIQLKNRSP